MEVNYINGKGDVVPWLIKRSQLNNPINETDQNSEYEKEYKRAYVESGAEEFEKDENNLPRDRQQQIHSTGAHEEVHLRQYNKKLSTYESEKPAFENQVKEGKEYIENIRIAK